MINTDNTRRELVSAAEQRTYGAMLTTGHAQYLNPDYVQPLPTTLDANKSPLALLAQTCSAIGKDPSPTKSNSSEKNEGDRDNVGSKSGSPLAKSASPDPKTERSSSSQEKRNAISPPDIRLGLRESAPKDVPPLLPITGDRGNSPGPNDGVSVKIEREESGRSSKSPANSTPPVSSSRLSLSASSLITSSDKLGQSTALPATLKHDHLAASLPPSLYPGMSYLALPIPGMDPSSAAHHLPHSSLSAASALALSSHHKLAVSGHLPGGLGHSPYSYARMKTASGASTLVPICRDPYCTGCQFSMHSAQLGSACAAGCTQCTHDKPYNGVASSLAASALSSTVPAASLPGSLSAAAHLSSLYGHAFGVLPGHSSLPYVCNWVSGSDYCGKRFTTSEELLQHLRTHTSSSDVAHHAGLPGYPGLGLSPAALAAAHGSPYLGSLSPNSLNSLRHPYPRSVSPSSLLAARYHPYKSPLSGLPPPSALSGLPSTLPPYYSPYAALYNQRLGPAVAP